MPGATTLIVPGLRDSGPSHWQSWLQQQLPDSRRVIQENWTRTCLSDWAARVGQALHEAKAPVWIVAHSFGCLASVTAGFVFPEKIRGALLVAPADPARFNEPAALLEEKLAFPTLVVASSNDPWVKAERAAEWAGHWGADYRNVGPLGHINVDPGHGPWPAVFTHLEHVQSMPACRRR